MLSDSVDALVCDLDGVVYRGAEPVSGAAESICRLRARGVQILFCTNNSAPTRDQYLKKLNALGLDAAHDELLTSSVVLEDVLRSSSRAGEKAFVVGGAGLREAVSEAGLQIAAADDLEGVSCVCVGFDPEFTYESMRAATTAVLAGADLYATNADASFPAPQGLWPGAGAILASIETASGERAEVVGKPSESMIDAIGARLKGRSRIAIVGDRVDTDMVMGRRAGWRTCLVLSGVTSGEPRSGWDGLVDEVHASLADVPWVQ